MNLGLVAQAEGVQRQGEWRGCSARSSRCNTKSWSIYFHNTRDVLNSFNFRYPSICKLSKISIRILTPDFRNLVLYSIFCRAKITTEREPSIGLFSHPADIKIKI